MMTYASYASTDMPIKTSALTILIMNIAIAILAGLAIFPALETFGYQAKEGPGLLFIILPLVLKNTVRHIILCDFLSALFICSAHIFYFTTRTERVELHT